MLLVPELNALPGRHAYDQTEFLNTDEILDRVDSIDEAAVLSTCDRYCVFVATKKNLTEALRDVETVISREIAVRAGRTGRQLLLPHAEGGAQAIAGGTVLCALSASTTIAHVQTISTVMNTHDKTRRARAAAPFTPRFSQRISDDSGARWIHSLCVPLNRYFRRRNSHASVLSGFIFRSQCRRLSSVSNTTNAEVTDPVPLDFCAS